MHSELTQRLAAADPALNVHLDIPDETWRQLCSAVIDTEPDRETLPAGVVAAPPHKPTLRARRAAIVLVAATVLIAAPVGFNLAGRPSGASVAAAGVLDRAAITAVDPAAMPDQYWKITTTGGNIAMSTDTRNGVDVVANWWMPDTTTTYVAVNGARPTFTVGHNGGTVRQISGEPGVDRIAPSSSIETTNLSPNDTAGGWQTPNQAFFDTLPTDLRSLRDRLYSDAEGHGKSTDGEVFVNVADALRSGLVPAPLRSTLFQVLKTVPGVDVTARAVTIAGRTGVAIARTETEEGGSRQEIIIDPDSGVLIGERRVAVDDSYGVPVGTVINETSVTRTLVDEVPPQVRERAHYSTCRAASGGDIVCN